MKKYINVPEKIWYDENLSLMARRLYLLMDVEKEKGNVDFDFSNVEIGEYFIITPNRASQIVNELIRAGYIELVSFDGRKRVLRIKEE